MAKFFMKKNIFLFYVLAFGLPCSAFGELQKNWEIVTVDNEAVYFLDRNSITLSEEQIGRVWQLKNFRQIKGFHRNPYLPKWIMIARNLGSEYF